MKRWSLLLFIVVLALAGTSFHAQPAPQESLKDNFKKHFLIGAALNRAQFEERDQRGGPIIAAQFNTITPENVLKWALVHPRPDAYDFTAADRYVAFGEKHGMFIVGHTLVWHRQTPLWVFQNAEGKPIGREALLTRLRDHIQTVVGRYKGRIRGWDVVNEALNEDGSMRQSPWMKIIGEDYVARAFEFAHEADPQAELYYNDYSLENEAKRKGAIELLKKLQSRRIPLSAVGLQGHDRLEWPTLEQQDKTITAFAKLGIKVNITELDIDVLPPTGEPEDGTTIKSDAQLNPYPTGLPDAVQKSLAARYADLFRVFIKHEAVIDRVTFWGVTDGDSWLNNWPVRGRTSYPLLWDRQGQPKPAFDAVLNLAR
jgi:endo-1,4-beta-xylanase